MKVDRRSKLSFNNKFQVIQVLICPFRFLEKKKIPNCCIHIRREKLLDHEDCNYATNLEKKLKWKNFYSFLLLN